MSHYSAFMKEARREGRLVVQPRMGFSDPKTMRRGLEAVRDFPGRALGTLTLDSLTRQGLFDEAARAVGAGETLNGWPLVSRGADATAQLVAGVFGPDFPVQVRHGSPRPGRIFEVAAAAGLDATEGGPISYCLPYGRVPLAASLRAWDEALRIWAAAGGEGRVMHVESFAGCMMGQLCPPSLLLALGVLEGAFCERAGVKSLSLSYAQGTHHDQDVGALLALEALMERYLRTDDRHVVLYTFMGLFPETEAGARRLMEDSARIAVEGGAARIIVKTVSEAREIPTIEKNVEALEVTAAAADAHRDAAPRASAITHRDRLVAEATALVDTVLALDTDLSTAILQAFQRGLLDVPYCVHPDNRDEARPVLLPDGEIRWRDVGAMPLRAEPRPNGPQLPRSEQLRQDLEFNRHRYDGEVPVATLG